MRISAAAPVRREMGQVGLGRDVYNVESIHHEDQIVNQPSTASLLQSPYIANN
jgi:hypothetical protein